MSKYFVLKNTTGSTLSIDDLGILLPANSNTNVSYFDIDTAYASTQLDGYLSSGSIILNDGSKDLSYSAARILLTAGPDVSGFALAVHAHTKDSITDFSHEHDDLYNTKSQVSALLSGYYSKTDLSTSGSAVIDWDNLANTPLVFAPDVHNHDSLYYTKSQVDVSLSGYYSKSNMQTSGGAQVNWGNLTSVPSSFTPSAHSHDDRYYTETESDAKYSLSTHNHDTAYYTKTLSDARYAAIVHNHDTAYYTKTLSDARYAAIVHNHDTAYYTKSQIDTSFSLYYTKTNLQSAGSASVAWGNLSDIPTSFTPSTHTHDDRYYTESESDAKYSLLGHAHTKANISDFVESDYVHMTGTETVAGNKTFSGNMNISGNLTVSGTVTTVNSQTINLADNIVLLNSDYTGSNPTENSGIEIKRGTVTNASLIWDETANKWKAGLAGSETEISLLGHIHDDRYYTEGEIDYKLLNLKTAGVKKVVDQYEDLLAVTDEIPGTVYIVRERSGVKVGQSQLYEETENTIIHMKFDGSTVDEIGHTNTGGGSAITYEAGQVGQAGVFNNSFRTYANTADLNVTSNFSCGVWFYPTQLDPAKSYSLFDKYPTNGSQSGWGLIIEEGGKIQLWAMGPTQPFVRVRTYSKLRLNQWTHIGLSFDGTVIKLWKNGVVVAELPFNGNIGANTAPLDIGRYYTDYIYGKMDDLFYTRDTLFAVDFQRIVNNGIFADYRDEGFWMWDGTQWTFLIQNMSGIYHNELLGINCEEMIHLTKNEYSGLAKGLDGSAYHTHGSLYNTKSEITDFLALKSDTGHAHDDRYYTKAQSDAAYATQSWVDSNYLELSGGTISGNLNITGTISSNGTNIASIYAAIVNVYTKTNLQTSGQASVAWGNLTGIPASFTPSSHTHDDRYYTESESDAKYAVIVHNHDSSYYTKTNLQTAGQASVAWGNLSGVPTTFVPSTHDHNSIYYLKTESDVKYALTAHLHDDRYYTESEITTNYYSKTQSDARYSVTTHTHDDRYLTEAEINALAVSVTYATISANDSNTDVTAQELEALTNGSNADGLHTHDFSGSGGGTLDEAYGNCGEGRVVNVDSGAVELSASNGFAPLKLTSINYTPNQWLAGGEIFFKDNEMWFRDSTRAKFVSFASMAAQFSSNSNGASGYAYFGNASGNSQTGFSMPWDGVIVGISGRCQNNANARVDIRLNGSTEESVYWGAGVNWNSHLEADWLNVNFSKDDDITIYLDGNNSKPNRPCIVLYVRRRI